MKKVNFKALTLGLIVLLLADGLGEVALTYLLNGRVVSEEVKLFYTHTPHIYWRTIEAILALFIAGYVTAKFTKQAIYLNTAILGFIALLFTCLAFDEGWHPIFALMAFVTQVPFVMLGGFVVIKLHESRTLSASAS